VGGGRLLKQCTEKADAIVTPAKHETVEESHPDTKVGVRRRVSGGGERPTMKKNRKYEGGHQQEWEKQANYVGTKGGHFEPRTQLGHSG